MFDKLHIFLETRPHNKLYSIVVPVIILIGMIGMISGYQFAKKSYTKTETYTQITSYPTIPSNTQPYPTQIPIATQSTDKQAGFQKCLEDANRTLQDEYNEMCERWKKKENSGDCPGLDLVERQGEGCYAKFGIPTPTEIPS